MKFLLLLVYCIGVNSGFIYPGLTTSAGNKWTKKIVGDIEDSCDLDHRYDIKLIENEEDVTNADNIVRPCFLEDLECIRQFFKANSNCKPAYGPVSDPLCLKQNTIFFQFTNMTLTYTNLEVRGLSKAEIMEFYYNKVTGNVVFAIKIPKLIETTPKGYISYKRTAKEPIVKADVITVTYTNNTFTATIPRIPKLLLNLADINAYIPSAAAGFFIGPKAYESTDPDVTEAYASLLESVKIVKREAFLFQAQLYAAVYIQENICDFGLKLYSI